MDTTTLFKKFDEAHAWNGALFTINKIAKTAISFVLYSKLSSLEFSAWANSYSFVYIFLLWFNFGFSRSIPQFALYFAKNSNAKKIFISKLIQFKFITTLCACALLVITAPYLTQLLSLGSYLPLFYLGCCLFVVESIKSILQLLFYSYLWHKRFNILDGFTVAINAAIVLFLTTLSLSTMHLLYGIFFSHIVTNMLLITLSYFMLGKLERDENYQGNENVDRAALTKSFAVHSGAMWGLISINSITERNVLIPLITATLGHGAAGIFKVANDGALLFQRFVIKTIGTTGTSLITHLDDNEKRVAFISQGGTMQRKNAHAPNPKRQTLVFDGMWKLTKRIATLIAPLLILLAFLIMLNPRTHFSLLKNPAISQTFLLLTSLYLFQILFLAYDHVLEVRREYKKLFISCIPYLGIALFYVSLIYFKIQITLIIILLTVHALRIASLFIRVYYASRLFLKKINNHSIVTSFLKLIRYK